MPSAVSLAVLGAPLRSSLLTEGTELAATHLRSFAVSGAALAGVDVVDAGDVALPPPGTSDYLAGGPVPRNEARVRDSLRLVAARIEETVLAGRTPVVFGGDATVDVALLAGIQDGRSSELRLGVVSLDGAARFRTPETAPGGDLESMVLSLEVGRGPLSLARLARERFPLVQESDVVLAGVRDALPAEAASLAESRIVVLTPDRLVGREGEAVFMGALGRLAQRTRDVVLLLDASVLDPTQLPAAVGEPSPGGLSLEGLKTLGRELSRWHQEGTIRLAGVSVTGVDARKDPAGVHMHELAGFALRCFRGPTNPTT